MSGFRLNALPPAPRAAPLMLLRTWVQSDAARVEAEAAEKRRWSFLEVDEARDEETAQQGLATQVGGDARVIGF